jgi:hypothetical protein
LEKLQLIIKRRKIMLRQEEVRKMTEGTGLPRLFNLDEVSKIVDIPIGTLYNMRWQGILPCKKIGRRVKMTEEQIQKLINMEGSLYNQEEYHDC